MKPKRSKPETPEPVLLNRLVRRIHAVSCKAFLSAGGPPNEVNESYDKCPPEVKAAYLAIAKWHLDNSPNSVVRTNPVSPNAEV